MRAEQTIQPINIAAATMLVQLIIIALLALGASICKNQPWKMSRLLLLGGRFTPGRQLRNAPILLIALVSFAALLISEDLYSIWSPLFNGVGIRTISTISAICIAFVLDLLLIGYLIFSTGSSSESPFLAPLFTIPTLAIFLRLPPAVFLSLAMVAIVIYGLMEIPTDMSDGARATRHASTVMNIACLLLSLFTGYITRPVAIDELRPVGQHQSSADSARPEPSAQPKE